MVHYVKQGNIFGRVGTALGKSLAEQAPKEIEHQRLRSGLQSLADKADQGNLSPAQFLAQAAGTYGATPQMVQSFGELARQQGMGQGLRNFGNQQQQQSQQQDNPLRSSIQNQNTPQDQNKGFQSDPRGFVTTEKTKYALDPYIPRSLDQLKERGAEFYDQNRQLYPTPELAMNAAVQEDQQEQAISNAQQAARQSQIGVENRVTSKLEDLRKAANGNIPDRIFQEIENDVLDQVSKGKGETQAAKYGQKKIDEVSRNFAAINSWGGLGLPTNSKEELIQSINTLQSEAKKGGYQKDAADEMIAKNKVTPQLAYAAMIPVKDNKRLNFEINSLPPLKNFLQAAGQGIQNVGKNENSTKATLDAAPAIARAMGLESSPLAIAYELDKKGYDGAAFKKYLDDNKKNMNLSTDQLQELLKPQPGFYGQLNDWWLKSFSGVE